MGQTESKNSETKSRPGRNERRLIYDEERSKRATPPATSLTTHSQHPMAASTARMRSSAGTSRSGPNNMPKIGAKNRPLSGGRPRLTSTPQQQMQASPPLRIRPRLKQQLDIRTKPFSKKERTLQTPISGASMNPGDDGRMNSVVPLPVDKPVRSKPITISRPPNSERPVRPRTRAEQRRSTPQSRSPREPTTVDDPEEKSPPAKRITRRSAQKAHRNEEHSSYAAQAESNPTKSILPVEIGRSFYEEEAEHMAGSAPPSDEENSDSADGDDENDDDELGSGSDASEKLSDDMDGLTDGPLLEPIQPVENVQPDCPEEGATDVGDATPGPEVAAVRRTARSSRLPAAAAAATADEFHLRRSRRRSVPVRRLQVDPHRMVYVSV